jgi:uncharacterized protein YacL
MKTRLKKNKKGIETMEKITIIIWIIAVVLMILNYFNSKKLYKIYNKKYEEFMKCYTDLEDKKKTEEKKQNENKPTETVLDEVLTKLNYGKPMTDDEIDKIIK